MKRAITPGKIFSLLVLAIVISPNLFAQTSVNRDTMIVAARDIISQTTYCGLVTIDLIGQPQVRTMNPFPVEDDLVIWFATSRDSRKVRELKNNPKVAVYFSNHNSAIGYVNISGKAEVIDDKELLQKKKRDYWEGIPNWKDIFVLIKIVPDRLEVINYKHGLNNDPKTFKAPTVEFY
ncbi:MAG TPA: pyridoxamine 5'-phosphate oxidase family protein [Draconibacterium sp.]|nr:pyridoxamine 5'-phosphate oxidase family protein [Draconibacterium sp.]